MKFILPLPKTTNHGYATNNGRWYKTADQKIWETECAWLVKKQRTHTKTMTGTISAYINLFLKRDRDIDGSIKPLLDLLQRTGIYANDSQITYMVVTKTTDKKTPRAEVTIEKL